MPSFALRIDVVRWDDPLFLVSSFCRCSVVLYLEADSGCPCAFLGYSSPKMVQSFMTPERVLAAGSHV